MGLAQGQWLKINTSSRINILISDTTYYPKKGGNQKSTAIQHDKLLMRK